MKNVIVLVAAIMLMATGVFAAGGDMGVGTDPNTDGSAAYPYLIEDLADFDVFADPINSATYWASGVYTKLACDPNLMGRPYTTSVIAPDGGDTFQGIFDGNDHTISNLTINTAGANNDFLGLFGKIDGGDAEVNNLAIVNCNITGGANSRILGGLCGINLDGTLTNCHSGGSVNGGYMLGGLCGSNDGTLTNCYAAGSVDGETDFLGGLCGKNYGPITNCYATGSVAGGGQFLGGLCGNNYGPITNCYATGSVDGGGQFLGGLCGSNLSETISNCYATGSVTGGDGSNGLGGVCGKNEFGTITNCYSTGAVAGGAGSNGLGGLCGKNEFGTIINCYSGGSVAGGAGSYGLGGLCGDNFGTISNCYSGGSVDGDDFLGGLGGYNGGTISNCYSSGLVDGDDNLGGLCGLSNGLITNCFWDTDTSGIPDPEGGLAGTDTDGMTGMTTIQMQAESNFTDAGWDFDPDDGDEADWWMYNGRDYPRLFWQPFGDLNNDSHVNLVDFSILAGQWQLQRLLWDIAPPNPDGAVNLLDFAAFVKDWTGSAEDFIELAVFAGQWLQPGASNADIAPVNNADGVVDILDLQALAEQWPEGPQFE